jgi:redox-sensitive bicupin YhaK (pirin superfamily)
VITIRKSSDRGHLDYGWLDTRHTFSFGRYHDPKHMGYRSLRVINDDRVAPGKGFGQHPHENMEIITYVLSGALAHKDTTGGSETLRPGEVQRMTAGTGIEHSEFNPSATEPVHLIQIWIEPGKEGLKPGYEQKRFSDGQGGLRLVASPDAADGSVTIHQDARLYIASLKDGQKSSQPIAPGRGVWVHVTKGALTVNGQKLTEGDGAAIESEKTLELSASPEGEALVFDLA